MSSSSDDDAPGKGELGAAQREAKMSEQKAMTKSLRANLANRMAHSGHDDGESTWAFLQVPVGAVALKNTSFFIFSGSNKVRIFIYNMIKHKVFEGIIIALILTNCVFLALDDPTTTEKPAWHFPVEVFYTVAFSIEMVLKMFALGSFHHKGAYHRDSWNNLDFVIVIFSYLNFLPGFGNLTAFRTLRVLRPLRSMNAIKGLKILVVGLLKSLGGLVHVMFLAGFIFCIFGILGVQLWMGRFRNRCFDIESGEVHSDVFCKPGLEDDGIYWGYMCPEGQECRAWHNPHFGFVHFDNLAVAFLVIFQMCTFEGWTEILTISYDVYGMISFPYFFFLIMIGSYLVPNLALAVINDKFMQAQREHEEQEAKRIEELENEARLKRNQQMNLRSIRANGPNTAPNISFDTETQTFHEPRRSVAPEDKSPLVSSFPTESSPGGSASPPNTLTTRRNTREEFGTVPVLQLEEATLPQGAVPPTLFQNDDEVEVHDAMSDDGDASRSPQQAPLDPGTASSAGKPPRSPRPGRTPSILQASVEEQRKSSLLDTGSRRGSAILEKDAAKSVSFAPDQPVGIIGSGPATPTHQGEQVIVMQRTGSLTQAATTPALQSRASFTQSRQQRSGSFIHHLGDDLHHADASTLPRTGSAIQVIDPSMRERKESLVGLLPTGQTVVIDLDEANSFGALPLHAAEDDEAYNKHVSEMSCGERLHHYIEVVRGYVHVMTEGYPRIISLFLFEQAQIQRRKNYGIDPGKNQHTKKAAQLMKRANQDFDNAGFPMTAVEAAEAVKEHAPTTLFVKFIIICILLNTALLASAYHNQPSWLTSTQKIGNYVLTGIFGVEFFCKLMALGVRLYVDDPFNVLDGSVVLMSFIEIGLSGSSTVSVFRALRLLRVLKLLKNFPSLRQIIRVMLAALSDTAYLNVIMALYLFIAALIGMQFFGGKFDGVRKELLEEGEVLRAHFDNFVYAIFAVFQVLTRDGWVNIMWNGMRATTPAAVLYFLGLVLLGDIVILSLFLAILISAFGDEEEETSSSTGSLMTQAFDFTAMQSTKRISASVFDQSMIVPVEPQEVFKIHHTMAEELRHAQRRLERSKIRRQKAREAAAAQGLAAYDPIYIEGGSDGEYSSSDDDIGDDIPALHETNDDVLTPPPHLRNRHSSSKTQSSGEGKSPQEGSMNPFGSWTIRKDGDGKTPEKGPTRVRSVVFEPGRIDASGNLKDKTGSRSISPTTSQVQSVALVGEDNDQRAESTIVVAGETAVAAETKAAEKEVEAAMKFCHKCGTDMAAPLPPPPLVKRRTVEALHRQHCPYIAVRMAKQRILDTLKEYIDGQIEEKIPPTQRRVETVLGQAWSCGLLLNSSVESLLELDPVTELKSWDATLTALQMEQEVLDLRVGEEQVGRSLAAYAIANIPKEHHTNGGYSMFVFGPKNPFRIFCSQMVSNKWFDRIVLVLIILSSLAMVFDNPLDDRETTKYQVLEILDRFFTCCFVIEMLSKWVAKGVAFIDGAYFRDGWNYLDGSIVAISLISWIFSNVEVGFLKVFRTFRALRPLRVINRNRGLKMVVRTLLQSIRGITNVAMLSSLNYLIFGILGVQLFAGKLNECTDPSIEYRLNCTGSFIAESYLANVSDANNSLLVYNDVTTNYTRWNAPEELLANVTTERRWRKYNRNFDNIGSSILTMFEVSSGEWWMDVMWSGVDAYSVDWAPRKDHAPYIGFFFIVFYIISNFFLLNLFVGVVIYNFNSVKSHMDGLSLLTDEQRLWVSTQRLMLNFRPIPLMKAADSRLAKLMDRIVRKMWFELLIAGAILTNIIVIGMEHHEMHPIYAQTLEIFNNIFVGIFIIEAALKLMAYHWRYFTSGWNQFDFFLVVLSIVGLILASLQGSGLPIDPGLLRVFRIFRIMRILRLVRSARKVRILLETLWYSLPSLGNIGSFMLLVYFIFAILGVQLFAQVQPGDTLDMRYTNFRTFENALQLLFRFTTVEDWNAVMHDLMVSEPECSGSGCGTPAAPVYFVFFMLMSSFVITNLFIAIILDNFETTMRIDQSDLKMSDLHRFIEIWAEYDPEATMMMPTHLFPNLLAKLQPPLGISRSEGRLEIIQRTCAYRIPEHGGYVHFVEVLIPLARYTMHVTLSERDIREHEEMWRATFPNLQSLPILRYRQQCCTIDMYFCSTYIASAFRRRVAKILANEMRVERHRAVKKYCLENGMDPYAFTSSLLRAPSMHISDALRKRLLGDTPTDTSSQNTRSASRGGAGSRGVGSSSITSPVEQLPDNEMAATLPMVGDGSGSPSPHDHEADERSSGGGSAWYRSSSFRNSSSFVQHAGGNADGSPQGLPMPRRLKGVITQPQRFGPESPHALRKKSLGGHGSVSPELPSPSSNFGADISPRSGAAVAFADHHRPNSALRASPMLNTSFNRKTGNPFLPPGVVSRQESTVMSNHNSLAGSPNKGHQQQQPDTQQYISTTVFEHEDDEKELLALEDAAAEAAGTTPSGSNSHSPTSHTGPRSQLGVEPLSISDITTKRNAFAARRRSSVAVAALESQPKNESDEEDA